MTGITTFLDSCLTQVGLDLLYMRNRYRLVVIKCRWKSCILSTHKLYKIGTWDENVIILSNLYSSSIFHDLTRNSRNLLVLHLCRMVLERYILFLLKMKELVYDHLMYY